MSDGTDFFDCTLSLKGQMAFYMKCNRGKIKVQTNSIETTAYNSNTRMFCKIDFIIQYFQ